MLGDRESFGLFNVGRFCSGLRQKIYHNDQSSLKKVYKKMDFSDCDDKSDTINDEIEELTNIYRFILHCIDPKRK